MRRSPHADDHVTPPADPPRRIPPTLGLQLVFGGLGQLGWFFLGFGAVFVAVFIPGLDLGPLVFRGPNEIVWAEVTGVEKSGYSQSSSHRRASRRGNPVYAYTFTFDDKTGKAHTATSFGGKSNFAPGSRAQIEYLVDDPATARILGQRLGPVAIWVALVGLIPIVGIVLLILRIRSGLRAMHLLHHGRVGKARLVERTKLDRHVNNKQVFRLTFEYQDAAGQTHRRVADTHEPRRLTDEREECVVYHPWRPERSVMLDELPVRIRTDGRGELLAAGTQGWLTLIIPTIAIATIAALVALLS